MLENLQPAAVVKPCRVRTVLEGLPDADSDALKRYLVDVERWNPNALSLALRNVGVDLTRDAIYRHRKGVCSC